MMNSIHERIERAAYHRWLRRGGRHGHDRNDWIAAEKDLRFARNYRSVVRQSLTSEVLDPRSIGQNGVERRRLCRFCELAEPAVSFADRPRIMPVFLDLVVAVEADECDECRAHHDTVLARPFEAFTRPVLGLDVEPMVPEVPAAIPFPALKALVRIGLAVLPASELPYYGDALEWVANPDHVRDASAVRSGNLGCQVYITPEPVPVPFASLARRASDDAPFPYMLFFLGARRVVFQIHLPFSPRDENLEDERMSGPVLSMSVGQGDTLRESITAFLPIVRPWSDRYGRP
jgi:hypothetical protein